MSDDISALITGDQLVDITTTGRRSGEARRVEIGLHPVGSRLYITGVPGFPRSWYANLLAHPAFTLHLKRTADLDLDATARPITNPAEREEVLGGILPALAAYTSVPGREPEIWIKESPLVEVTLDS
jgi:deazaflavin-dependent oxidoreductase (nitroreductase family)